MEKIKDDHARLQEAKERELSLWDAMARRQRPKQKPLTRAEKGLHRRRQRAKERKANARRDALRAYRQQSYYAETIAKHQGGCTDCTEQEKKVCPVIVGMAIRLDASLAKFPRPVYMPLEQG